VENGPVEGLPHRPLGSSGLQVSLMSLGSWRTYERLPRDGALAVMVAAREAGITFLDDARYDDETGEAPIPTGWSEVLFGELFRAAGWVRDEVVVANKLWWEFWPDQSAAAELDASLDRMGLEHVDLIYAMTLPPELAVADAVAAVSELVSSGRARAWGVANWQATAVAEAVRVAAELGVAGPCAAQLPYSLVRRDWVEDPTMDAALGDGGIGLVASYALAGGTLTGKYQRGEQGRASGVTDDPNMAAGLAAGVALDRLAAEWDVPAAHLALAFALDHPRLSSVLFGATSPAQVQANVAAIETHHALDADQLARLRTVTPGR
jgi:aryl-alcohol dehydrogenase-like predicted oxidoreductase